MANPTLIDSLVDQINTLQKELEKEKAFADVWETNANKAKELIDKLTGQLKAFRDAEKQGLLINLSKQYTTTEVKNIFHTLLERCYGVPISKEITDFVVDDLMR